jgi:hypothetical protein
MNMHGRSEKNHEGSQDSFCPSWDPNSARADYKSKDIPQAVLLGNVWDGLRNLTILSRLPSTQYSSAPVFTGNMFQDLPRLRETADNTDRYI